MKQKTYAGAIQNTGSQIVKAPFDGKNNDGKTVAKTGSDLRSKGGK